MHRITSWLIVMVALLSAMPVMAEVPRMINYQGWLTDNSGNPFDTTLSITFAIYASSEGGTPIWTELHTIVYVADGAFSVILGSASQETAIPDSVFSDPERYLGIKIGSDSEISPRTRLVSSPYSIRAGSINGFTPGPNNLITGQFSFAAGDENTIVGDYCVIGGGHDNLITNARAPESTIVEYEARSSRQIDRDKTELRSPPSITIGGGQSNIASAWFSTIGGGFANEITLRSRYATVAGGSNYCDGAAAAIGGGVANQALADYTTIGGGGWSIEGDMFTANFAFDKFCTIGGGGNNWVGTDNVNEEDAAYATLSGGLNNRAQGYCATIGGGASNEATGDSSFIGGGALNVASELLATVGGGLSNLATDTASTVSGGQANEASGNSATVGGGWGNGARDTAATVSGGLENSALQVYSTIGGGAANLADGIGATVGGGGVNQANGEYSTVSGGRMNSATGDTSTVSGGVDNTAGSVYSTVSGGRFNQATGTVSTIGGGRDNEASANGATIAGGTFNRATASWSVVSGGTDNQATGQAAMIAGGTENLASGDWSFAAGRRALAMHDGAFVWGDHTNAPLSSTADDQFLIRAAGGVGIGTSGPLTDLHLAGSFFLDGSGFSHGIANTDVALTVDGATGEDIARFRSSGGSQVVTFDSQGWVGIRESSPSQQLDVNGNVIANAYYSHSDRRLKKNINTLSDALSKITGIRGVSFRWRRDNVLANDFPTGAQVGFIAQELREQLPETVIESENGYLSVDYNKITPFLVEAIKELKSENDALKTELARLSALIETVMANQQNISGNGGERFADRSGEVGK